MCVYMGWMRDGQQVFVWQLYGDVQMFETAATARGLSEGERSGGSSTYAIWFWAFAKLFGICTLTIRERYEIGHVFNDKIKLFFY
jgi:hypothetical protein